MLDDAASRWKTAFSAEVTRAELKTRMLADVDGDGRREQIVLTESQCGSSGNCPELVYVSHGGCTRLAASFWAEWETEKVLPRVRHGLRDIETYLKGGCAGLEGSVLTWGFDGTTYRQLGRVECACPETPAGHRRDPRCP